MGNGSFFGRYMGMKYGQQQQEIDNTARYQNQMGTSALGNMMANRQNANTNVFQAKSQDFIGRQNADTNRVDVDNRFKLGTDANDIDRMDANNRFTLGTDANAIDRMDAENRFTLGTRQNDINSMIGGQNYMLGKGQLAIDSMFKNGANLRLYGQGYNLEFKRGTSRVPGKGSGDKVPALLEPGEAVLNKKAAGMIGRDKIAKANAKGNQMREKQAASTIAKMVKQMGMV